MDEALKGKVAIVTGAGRGLGRAMALGLARAGAQVLALAARERTEVEVVAAEALHIHPLVADVTQPEDCARVVEVAVSRFGGLHILINNAGRGMRYVSESFMTEPTRFWEIPPETWRLVMIPARFPAERLKDLLEPSVMVLPLLWLASERSGGTTGQRFVASRWSRDLTEDKAIEAARDTAGWPGT